MKQRYIIFAVLLSLLTSACYKDKSNEFELDLPQVEVSGLDSSYTVYSYRDTLRISPTVKNESRYEFFWTAYSKNFTQGTGVVTPPDTLSRTRDLDYQVVLNPGPYVLVFNVRDKQTAVTEMITRDLNVSTLTMQGWYLLKDDGQKTDFDFIYPQGRIDNWIANFNEGKNLSGRAVKAIFVPQFKLAPASTDLFNVFAVISENDATFCRIDNGLIVMDFDHMFFRTPGVRKPQNILQPMATNDLALVNDNKLYTMVKGTLFADPPASSYNISPVAAIGALPIYFDENSKSVICYDYGNFVALGANGNALKNMDNDIIWMTGYAGLRGVALALFGRPESEGLLVKMDVRFQYLNGSTSPLIMASQTVPASHGLMAADAIGGNYDADYIYYAKGNQVYLTDVVSLQERLQVTLPAGERVTCIQHIKYPQPAANVAITTDYLAIASYANGHYKVWLHRISSTGTIQPLSGPDFEGEGRVSSINYVEQGLGNRTY